MKKVRSPEEIKNILETAAYVDRLLPAVRAPKYRCFMPQIVYTAQEIAFMDRRSIRPRPTQEQVGLWEMVVLGGEIASKGELGNIKAHISKLFEKSGIMNTMPKFGEQMP